MRTGGTVARTDAGRLTCAPGLCGATRRVSNEVSSFGAAHGVLPLVPSPEGRRKCPKCHSLCSRCGGPDQF
ncbi:hypothetical protein NL676_006167 [Syzygium grande]|nr:hypothetical protein NL676_006167 [Syzygium grande]